MEEFGSRAYSFQCLIIVPNTVILISLWRRRPAKLDAVRFRDETVRRFHWVLDEDERLGKVMSGEGVWFLPEIADRQSQTKENRKRWLTVVSQGHDRRHLRGLFG